PPHLHSFPTRRSSDLIRDIPYAHMAETARHDGRARLSDETTHRYLGGAIHGLSSTSCFFCGGSRCRLYSCGTRLVSDLCAINTRDRKSTRLNSSHVKI